MFSFPEPPQRTDTFGSWVHNPSLISRPSDPVQSAPIDPKFAESEFISGLPAAPSRRATLPKHPVVVVPKPAEASAPTRSPPRVGSPSPRDPEEFQQVDPNAFSNEFIRSLGLENDAAAGAEEAGPSRSRKTSIGSLDGEGGRKGGGIINRVMQASGELVERLSIRRSSHDTLRSSQDTQPQESSPNIDETEIVLPGS